jgi:WD40 repeat protein
VEVWTIACDPHGARVATGSNTGNINIFDFDSGERTQVLETKGKFVMSVAYVCVGLKVMQFCGKMHTFSDKKKYDL